MATAKRESLAKNLLDQRHPRKTNARKLKHPLRGHRHLVKLSEEELSRRELGWNDRFTVNPSPMVNKMQPPTLSPTSSTPPTPLGKESKIHNERAQYGKRGGKRNREPKKPSSGKLIPLGSLSKSRLEAEQPTKEEKLRFKVLKAIDARETLLYQLSALILCTPVQESLFLPSRPIEPPTSIGQHKLRSRGGVTLASSPLIHHGANSGAMTNAREATNLAQQLSKDLQFTGIQCVEALVEWMLEAGAQAETPPPFLWRGRNYFLKMANDLDFAEAELQARGVNLDCFSQTNPLLVKPNQKLGRVLAAHSIIMEFTKDDIPKEMLALSGRMCDFSHEEKGTSTNIKTLTNSSIDRAGLDAYDDSEVQNNTLISEHGSIDSKPDIKRHDHASTADLVDLLDESLDFSPENISRGRNSALTELSFGNNFEDDAEKDENNERKRDELMFRLPSENIVTADDTLTSDVKLEDGDSPRMKGAQLEKEEALADNQSENEDNSMDDCEPAFDRNSVKAAEAEIMGLPKAQHEEANASGESELVVSDTGTVEDAARQDKFGHIRESTPGNEQLSSRAKDSDNQSEYDNSFDAEEGGNNGERESNNGGNQGQLEDAPENPESAQTGESAPPNENFGSEHVEDSPMVTPVLPEKVSTIYTEEDDSSEYENSFDEDVEDKASNHSDAERLDTALSSTIDFDGTRNALDISPMFDLKLSDLLIDAEIYQPVADANSVQTVSERLIDELKRWAFLEDENRPTEVNVHGCLSWCNLRLITERLQTHSSISEGMEGSVIAMLEQYGLAVPESPLKSLLSSVVARELDLTVHLSNECQYVLDEVSSTVATALQHSLESTNSLVSEIEIEELLENAEAVRQVYDESTWKYFRISSALLIFLRSSDEDIATSLNHQPPPSAGLSRLVKVFYPYLVNKPREELRDNWHSVSSILVAMGLPVSQLYHLLDPLCKTLLLAVKLFHHSNQDSHDEDEFAVFPKITIICDRDDVLQSSVDYVSHNHFSSDKVSSNFLLFPFFKSSFGEKLVNGVKVEEGEGKGPLKEWFGLIGPQMTSKWRQISTSKSLLEVDVTEAIASENIVKIPGATVAIRPGFRLEWDTNDGETISRVVNKCGEDDTFLLDRSVTSQTFPVFRLRIFQPTSAIFEYVQASESYWLNENTHDSPEARTLLFFVGWFFASAITHFSATQLWIHPLFFRLLLNPQYCVNIDDLRLLDPQLANSLSSMKEMRLSDFVEYLRIEGMDESTSVETYIGNVIRAKFGPSSGNGWQLDSIRNGFTQVITIDQLSRVGITENDLAESICGSGTSIGNDFDIASVFRVAADTELTNCEPLMNGFWKVVNAFEPQLKRNFIKFVTGVDTLPLGGTEFLRIEMPFTAVSAIEHEKCLQMLPQAHTCDNSLELPHYWKSLCWRENHDENKANLALEEELALLLRKKLQDAVEYSSGYGLDGTSAVAGVLDYMECPIDDVLLAKEESYDSLGLPALSEGHTNLPVNSLRPSSRAHENEETEQKNETVDTPVVSTSVVSPRPDDSYDEYDWEEEEQSLA